MKEPKIQEIDLVKIVPDLSRNVRENDPTAYDILPLAMDLALRGQITEMSVEKADDGNIYPLRGFRRKLALDWLADPTNLDPATKEPYVDPRTGKPFKTARVKIYEGLSDVERLTLMFDHGQTRNLSKIELANAMYRAFDAGVREIDVVRMAWGLLQLHYPPSRKIEDNDKDRLAYYKGVLQTLKNVWRAPYVVREAWEKKLKGQQNWPLKDELRELLQVFDKEQAADKTNTVTRANPGPEFKAAWDKLVQVKSQPEGEGTGKTRATTAMMNRTSVDDLFKGSDSVILKTTIDVIRNVIPRERYSPFDKGSAEMEATLRECAAGNVPADMQQRAQRFLNLLTVTIGTEEPKAKTTETETVTK